MAAKMLLVQPRSYSDNTKTAFKLSEKSRDIEIVRDEKVVSYLDDFTPTALVEENAEHFGDPQKLTDKTVSRAGSRGRTGKLRNGKFETRYRTSSTDSAFSEDSCVDLDSDESTKLESLIDQLIFTDDRLNPDMSIYTKTENLPSTDSSILDVGDLFNNTDIFTVDFESLTHDTHTPSLIESEVRPDAENTESISSISSADSGKGSMDKYSMKMSAFLESNLDKVLNNSDNTAGERFTKFSSNLFTSSDEDEVIDCVGNVATDTIAVFNSASGTRGSDGCVNDCVHDCVHESSCVDLSTLLDVTPYGSPFSVGVSLSVDSERLLNADDDENICVNESNSIKTECRDTRRNDNTPLQAPRPQIRMAVIDSVTSKSSNKSNDSENGIELTEVHVWPRKENQKMTASMPSMKNSREKCMDILDEKMDNIVDENIIERDEHSEESLYLYSFENLCGYGDQEMSGINQNNDVCHFLSGNYNDPQNRFTLKNSARTTDSTDDQKILKSSVDKCSGIKFSNQKNTTVGMDDPEGFNWGKRIDLNEPVVLFGTKNDTVKMGSYFHDSEFSKDIDAANIGKSQSMSSRVISNEDHVKSVVAKDHSYRSQIPDSCKKINMSATGTKEKNNRTNCFTNGHIKYIPAKRPLALNSVKQELATSEEEKSQRRTCLSSYAEFPGLKHLLEEESSALIESPLQKSTNNNYYNFNPTDGFGCIQRKVPKFSITDTDETCVQPTILYQVLAMEQHSPTASFSSPSYLPKEATVKDHRYSQSPSVRGFKSHCLTYLRQETDPKRGMSMQMKDELSEMGELEKYLRGIIPTESYDGQDKGLVDHQQENSDLIFRMDRPPCSFLKKLLTGEMTAQMYRKIDQQFYENELLIKNETKME